MTPKPLDETDLFVMFHEYEQVFLFDKNNNRNIWTTEMYGDPTCGLIGLSNEWALIGGSELIIWKNNILTPITDPELKWIHEFRQTGENSVRILTDPWNKNSAIWDFKIYKELKVKIRDFTDYHGKEYTDKVEW